MNKPRKLKPGDTIGILSTSSPALPSSIDRMRQYFEGKGYTVRVGAHTLADFGFLAGSAEDRAGDFNDMLRDPEVRMIVTSMGGAGAEHLLPLVDYETLAANPKLVVGLSNPAILLNAITARTGVPTIHGPNGVEFGWLTLTPFTEENFWPIILGQLSIPYTFPVGDQIRVVRAGTAAEGKIYGGHHRTVQRLIGTPWAPDWKGSILFLEEHNLVFEEVDKVLSHFKLAGILDSIKGLIFGQPIKSEPVQVETLEDVLLRICASYDFPIFSNVPIGHTDDKITLPLGCRVRMESGQPGLELLEMPVI
jgi:muramoyltetrapeptide carboxypeptidase